MTNVAMNYIKSISIKFICYAELNNFKLETQYNLLSVLLTYYLYYKTSVNLQ